MDTLILALIIGIFGGALSAVLGWLDSAESFDPKKFVSGLIRASIGGLGLAVIFPIDQGTASLVLLFLATVGIDSGASKVTNIVKKKAKKTSV